MTPERWHKVAAIFHAALEQASSEVDGFLRRECGADAALYSEVRALVEQHSLSGLLDQSAVVPLPEQPVFAARETVSGRYRIVRFLGRGGMGEVYEAEDLDLKERVALKTLLPEIAGDGRMIARFKQEIQLSRKISHPNVCRVFDLARHPGDGSAPHPVVYLTMEYLAGETLAESLRRETRLNAGAALPLLAQMAEALDAAHRAGVIHRDFKPSNVMLVSSATGVRAVVTDFGLARSLAGSGETTATLTGNLMGTLDYMAPELLTGDAASISSDVYALGMVAYRMVTGDLPFAAETPLAGAILRSKVPVPAPRAAVPDLDPAFDRAIIRALDPEPGRRFESAGQFIDALRGEAASVTVKLPVMTRRRAAAAVAAAVLLVAGPFGWREWVRYRNRPPAEALSFYGKGVDDIHAGAYFAATKALEQAVRLAPHYSLARARLAEAWMELDVLETARQEMLRARREDTSRLSDFDRLQIEAIDLTLTREYASAVEKYERMRQTLGEDSPDLDVDLGRAYEKARQPLKATESYRRAATGPSHSAEAWLRLAVLYARLSDTAKTDEAFRRAEESFQLSSNLEGLTEVAYQRGIDADRRRRLDEGASQLGKALETARLASNTQQEIRAKIQLANNAYLAGDTAVAERYARDALDTARTNQMETLAISGVINLGNAYLLKRDFTGAEKYYQDALTLARRNTSPHLTAVSLLSLAALHDQLKRSDDTAREAREALAYYQSNGFAQESFQCLTLLGRLERNAGNYSAALDSFRRSLEMAEKAQDRVQMALAHESVGSVLFARERYPEALEQYEKNLELSADAEHAAYAELECGNTLRMLGRFADAGDMFNRVEKVAEKFASLRLYLMQARAEMALAQNREQDAISIARRALASDPSQNPATGSDFKRILGLASLALGRKREALKECEDSLAAATSMSDAAASRRSRLALLQARLEVEGLSGALGLFQELKPALTDLPESRWRALALLAGADRQYAASARQALDQLAGLLGEAAYQIYLTRPDVRKLTRRLLQTDSAESR